MDERSEDARLSQAPDAVLRQTLGGLPASRYRMGQGRADDAQKGYADGVIAKSSGGDIGIMTNLDEVIADGLALMEGAGLRLYGRKLNNVTAGAYVGVCQSFGVADEILIRKAAMAFAADGGDFPDAAAFGRRCVAIRDAGMVAIGVPCEDGETIRIELVPVDDQMHEPRRLPPAMDRPAPELPAPKRVPKVMWGDDRDVETWKADQIRRLKE